MDPRYVLSIIIPTRNRAEYAAAAVRQILAIDQDDMQVVVQDNSDTDALRTLCGIHLDDPRLTYNHSPGTLSFVDNFDRALSLASGEYVTVIGDDDGINPELMDAVRWARARGVKAIKPGLQAVYFWPGVGLPFTQCGGDAGTFMIEPIAGGAAIRRTGPELSRLLHDGCQGYLERDLVKLYHGIVRRDALESVRGTTGRFFGGLSPDIYAAVALSVVIDDVVCIDYPLTIPGVCRTSGSADSGTGRHTGELRDAPHFAGHAEYAWAREVPEFYSVETIWADSALAALREMRRDDLVRQFRPQYLAAFCILHHPEFAELVTRHYLGLRSGVPRSLLGKRMALRVANLTIRFRERMARKRHERSQSQDRHVRLEGVADISAAADQLAKHLDAAGVSFSGCVDRIDAALAVRGADR